MQKRLALLIPVVASALVAACSAHQDLEPSSSSIDPVSSTTDVNPVKDAFVRDGAYASSNYGTGTSLLIKQSGSGYTRRSWLTFSTASFTNVTSAKLRLYVDSLGTENANTVPADLYTSHTDSWGETSITWNNAPAPGGKVGSINLTTASAGTWIEYDVTSQVAGDADGLVTFEVVSGTLVNRSVSFAAREDTTHRPVLRIGTGTLGSSSGTGSSSSGGTSGSSSGSSSGSAGDAGLPDAYGPVPSGGIFVPFVQTDQTTYFDSSQQQTPTGTVIFGASNAAAVDGKAATLTRKGGQATLGPVGGEEIVSQRAFGFGTYRFRAALASCASSEDLVNGLFTYFNDGTKAPDGRTINREVDIEVLCGMPWLINLTIWTEYNDDTHCKNQSRIVDTKTGTVYVNANDQAAGIRTGTENHPELLIPGWPQAGTFYELGWTWAPNHLRYFMNVNGTYVTLWDATDATRIPQAPMEQHFNLWAPGMHWFTGASAGPPANPSTLTLDWWRYDPM